MLLRMYMLIFAFGSLLIACGGDDGDDDSGGSNGPVNNAETEVVPESFTNSATSPADLSTKTTAVKSSTLDTPAGTLTLASATTTTSFLRALQGDTGADDQDLSVFDQELAVGTDCSGMFTSFAGFYTSMAAVVTSMTTQAAKMGDDFNTAGLASALYDVEALEKGTQFAFAYRLVPKAEDSPLPSISYKGGATDTSIAFETATTMNFSQEGSSNIIDSSSTLFADASTKTARFGSKTAATFTSGETTQSFSFNTEMTLQGGDNPSFTQVTNGTSSEVGGTFDMNFSVAKTAENSFTVTSSGTVDGKDISSSFTVTRSGTTCSVTAVE